MHKNQLLDDVRTWGNHKGNREYKKFLRGEQLTHKETCLAMCYSCTAGYYDGRQKCDNQTCPCLQFHPFTDYKPKNKIKRERSAKQIESSRKLALFNRNRT